MRFDRREAALTLALALAVRRVTARAACIVLCTSSERGGRCFSTRTKLARCKVVAGEIIYELLES